MSSFAIPLSGLIASQNQLQSISNNLANLDTVGYKDQNVSFSDLFAQSTASSETGPLPITSRSVSTWSQAAARFHRTRTAIPI